MPSGSGLDPKCILAAGHLDLQSCKFGDRFKSKPPSTAFPNYEYGFASYLASPPSDEIAASKIAFPS